MKRLSCLVTFFSLVIGITSCRPEQQMGIKERETEKEDYSLFYEEMLKEDQLTALYNENLPLSERIVLTNSKGKEVLLKESVNDSSIIVRYSVHACGDCITFVNTCLSEHVVNKERVVLLLADIPVRDIHVLKAQLKFPHIYQVDSLPLPYEETKEPYLFTLDKEYRTSYFFIPRKEIPEQTPKYLQFIIRKTSVRQGMGKLDVYGKEQASYFASDKATPAEEHVAGLVEYAFNDCL